MIFSVRFLRRCIPPSINLNGKNLVLGEVGIITSSYTPWLSPRHRHRGKDSPVATKKPGQEPGFLS